MFILQAIILGIVEGLTEFLPISSTGHLIIAEKYMSFHDEAKIFTVVIQVGAMLAVVWYYRHDIWERLRGLFGWKDSDVRFALNVLIAMLPASLLGVALDKTLNKHETAGVVAAALILGGIVLWLVDRMTPPPERRPKLNLDDITPKQALGVGLAQAVSLVPGVSRSGASIVGGLLGGMNRLTATTFSFYLGIPILALASGYKLVKGRHDLAHVSGGATSIIVGTIVSFAVALFAVSWLLKYVAHHNFRIFAYYRILLGIAVLVLL